MPRTAVGHVLRGKYLYALLCVAVLAVLVAPPLLARTSLGNIPVELELAALWGAVGDMTLGRMAGLYAGTIWFDKVLHGAGGALGGLLGSVYMRQSKRTARRIVAFAQLVPGERYAG